MSLYSFFSDRCFIDPADRTINLEQLDIPAGYLDREMIEHFVEPLELLDVRPDRLVIEYRPSTYQPVDNSVLIEDVLYNIIPAGQARLALFPSNTVTIAQYSELDYTEFETEVLPVNPVAISRLPVNFTFDATKLTADEALAISTLTDIEIGYMFNISEYLLYGTIPGDTLDQIESVLLADTQYTNYVPTTVRISQLHTAVEIFGEVNVHRFAPQWISFDYMKGGTTLSFTIWLDRNAFVINYPLYTIQTITPPLSLSTLLDPSTLSDPLEAAALSRDQVSEVLVPEILRDDQLGMNFTTRYIWNNNTYHLSFTIAYRGKALSPLEARIAIRDYLIASGTGTEALWGIRFPDIFLKNSKWIIPLFDRTTVTPISTIYPSVNSLSDMADKLAHFASIIDISVVADTELLTCAYANFFVGCLNSNTDEHPTFYSIHPTYSDVSTTDTGFDEMSEPTKQLSLILNNVLAIADGEINSTSYSEISLYGMAWLMIVHDGSAYFVLRKSSFFTSIASI